MLLAIFSALWLGILTSLSPCPLATNIAAVSFISKTIECPYKTVISGVLYTFGRVLTYVLLGFVVVGGLLSMPIVANFLQHYMSKIIGPILILIGLVLLEIVKFDFSIGLCKGDTCEKFKNAGFLGAFVLGIMFALSFCPVSAALFFGSLISIAIENNSRVLLPLCYGIGTGLPVVIFAVIIAFSMHKVGEIYHNILKFEFWFRKITGVIFLIAGVYFLANVIL